MPQFKFNLIIFDNLPIYIILSFFIIYGLIIQKFNILLFLSNNKKKIKLLIWTLKNIK